MSAKTTPSSHPSVSTLDPTPYPEIAEQVQRMDEREDAPTLPEVPPLPVVSTPPAPVAKDREGGLVRVCIALACLFFVALCGLAFTCQHR